MTAVAQGGAPIHVVAAAVTDATGRVLIAQRPPGKPLAGSWEFPGGKLEAGESRVQGLARELREELGIALTARPRPLIRVRHSYPFGEVLIDLWVVTRFSGQPRGLDGQSLRWCTQDELGTAELLPADRPIVRALRLPERLEAAESVHYCLRGIEGVEADDRGSGATQRGSVVGEGRLQRDETRPCLGERLARSAGSVADDRLVGVSCASAAEVAAAIGAGADFLVLSDVFAAEEITALCRTTGLPVYARGLGIEDAWVLGASGVAEAEL